MQSFFEQGQAFFLQQTGDPAGSQQMTLQALDDLRQQQAASLAYFDVFWLFAVLASGLVFLVPAHEALGGREGRPHRRGVVHAVGRAQVGRLRLPPRSVPPCSEFRSIGRAARPIFPFVRIVLDLPDATVFMPSRWADQHRRR